MVQAAGILHPVGGSEGLGTQRKELVSGATKKARTKFKAMLATAKRNERVNGATKSGNAKFQCRVWRGGVLKLRLKVWRCLTPIRDRPGGARGGRGASSAPKREQAPTCGRQRNKRKDKRSGAAASSPGSAPSSAGSSPTKRKGAKSTDEEDYDDEATDVEDSGDEKENKEHLEERLRREEEQGHDAYEEVGFTPAVPGPGKGPAPSILPHLRPLAGDVSYAIAIPTYGRWMPVCKMSGKRRFKGVTSPFILEHTLRFLSRERIPVSKVTLFVADVVEKGHYKSALQGSDWADVRIVVSVLGNMQNRNQILRHYKRGTYVVSIDDDVERIAWKFCDGISEASLRNLPRGGFERIIHDAYHRMTRHGAFLWGLNTSQNPRHMNPRGVSVKNGLVNGYLNGFITRPQCTELFRTLTDATEDSEFSVRHYNKDGVILRYRMYAGITSPYTNRGGLQTKFERHGETITSEGRSAARKLEERDGAAQLQQMFPRLIGPPRPRKDKKTMEVVFFQNGYPPGEGSKRRMIAPHLRDEDQIVYARNPKVVNTVSWRLYERYKFARTVLEARKMGARAIDFAFDSNWGYLRVTNLVTTPASSECRIHNRELGVSVGAARGSRLQTAKGETPYVKVRVKEMSLGHKGINVARSVLSHFIARCPRLCGLADDAWAQADAPLAGVSLHIVRILLHWSETGWLVFPRERSKAVHAALQEIGIQECARALKHWLKRVEAQDLKQERLDASVAHQGNERSVNIPRKRWNTALKVKWKAMKAKKGLMKKTPVKKHLKKGRHR